MGEWCRYRSSLMGEKEKVWGDDQYGNAWVWVRSLQAQRKRKESMEAIDISLEKPTLFYNFVLVIHSPYNLDDRKHKS